MQAQQLTIAVERLNGDIRSITEQISGSESRIAVLENDIARNEEAPPGCGRRSPPGGRTAPRPKQPWSATAPWLPPWKPPGRS